jgi:hypothetical protein
MKKEKRGFLRHDFRNSIYDFVYDFGFGFWSIERNHGHGRFRFHRLAAYWAP